MKDGAYWLKSHCGWAVVHDGQIVRTVYLAGIGLYRAAHGRVGPQSRAVSKAKIAQEAAQLANTPEGLAECIS